MSDARATGPASRPRQAMPTEDPPSSAKEMLGWLLAGTGFIVFVAVMFFMFGLKPDAQVANTASTSPAAETTH